MTVSLILNRKNDADKGEFCETEPPAARLIGRYSML